MRKFTTLFLLLALSVVVTACSEEQIASAIVDSLTPSATVTIGKVVSDDVTSIAELGKVAAYVDNIQTINITNGLDSDITIDSISIDNTDNAYYSVDTSPIGTTLSANESIAVDVIISSSYIEAITTDITVGYTTDGVQDTFIVTLNAIVTE